MAGVTLGKKPAQDLAYALADAVASVDIDQEDREKVADAVADVLAESRLGSYLNRDLVRLLAADPLVPCAGFTIPAEDADSSGLEGGTRRGGTVHFDCPNGTVIRQAMHLSSAPDGRSANWKRRAPFGEIRCVSCGSMQFIPDYRAAVLAESR